MKCICCKKNFKTTPDERAGFRAAGFYTPAWWVRDQSVDRDAMAEAGADPDDWNNMICFDCAEKASEIERNKYQNEVGDSIVKVVESHKRKLEENKIADAILDLVYTLQNEGYVNKIAADRFIKSFNYGEVEEQDVDILYDGIGCETFDPEFAKKASKIIYSYSGSTLENKKNAKKRVKEMARVSTFDMSPYDLRNQIKSYVRGRLYDLVGSDSAKNFKINQPKWDMVYYKYDGVRVVFAIKTQGDTYYLTRAADVQVNGLNWQGAGFEEFKEDFEDMVSETFYQAK